MLQEELMAIALVEDTTVNTESDETIRPIDVIFPDGWYTFKLVSASYSKASGGLKFLTLKVNMGKIGTVDLSISWSGNPATSLFWNNMTGLFYQARVFGAEILTAEGRLKGLPVDMEELLNMHVDEELRAYITSNYSKKGKLYHNPKFDLADLQKAIRAKLVK